MRSCEQRSVAQLASAVWNGLEIVQALSRRSSGDVQLRLEHSGIGYPRFCMWHELL